MVFFVLDRIVLQKDFIFIFGEIMEKIGTFGIPVFFDSKWLLQFFCNYGKQYAKFLAKRKRMFFLQKYFFRLLRYGTRLEKEKIFQEYLFVNDKAILGKIQFIRCFNQHFLKERKILTTQLKLGKLTVQFILGSTSVWTLQDKMFVYTGYISLIYQCEWVYKVRLGHRNYLE